MKLSSLCVYCGAATGLDPVFADAAVRLGRLMAESGVRLVYGGGSIGLMGVIARSVIRHGGTATGIIPRFLDDREIALTSVTELIRTADMHDRKRLLFEHADAFVALPGGLGTLDETVEMMTWAQLGRHRKPIALANIKGYWSPLVALFRHMEQAGFLHRPPGPDGLYTIIDRIDEVLPTLRGLLAALPAGSEASDVSVL